MHKLFLIFLMSIFSSAAFCCEITAEMDLTRVIEVFDNGLCGAEKLLIAQASKEGIIESTPVSYPLLRLEGDKRTKELVFRYVPKNDRTIESIQEIKVSVNEIKEIDRIYRDLVEKNGSIALIFAGNENLKEIRLVCKDSLHIIDSGIKIVP